MYSKLQHDAIYKTTFGKVASLKKNTFLHIKIDKRYALYFFRAQCWQHSDSDGTCWLQGFVARCNSQIKYELLLSIETLSLYIMCVLRHGSLKSSNGNVTLI